MLNHFHDYLKAFFDPSIHPNLSLRSSAVLIKKNIDLLKILFQTEESSILQNKN